MELNLATLKLEKLNSSVDGETVLFVGPAERIKQLTQTLSLPIICFCFSPVEPDPKQLVKVSEVFKSLIVDSKLTRLTLIGVEWGAAIVIHYASNNIKNVRRAVFVDAISRPKQLAVEKMFEWLERFLPLGLPFRPISKDFDPRPIIHRVRCPALVATQETSELGLKDFAAHAKFLMDKLPNAWQTHFIGDKFEQLLEAFIDVPTKQPQKAIRAANL